MTKSHTSYPSSSSSPASSSKLGIGTSSNLISKLKPKIRIIHVYAPEIIKIDAANFRELVQRLTGKPEDEEQEKGGRRRNLTKTPPKRLDPTMKEEQEQEFRIKKEGENDNNNNNNTGGGDYHQMWGRSRSNNGKFSGGFLEGFSEFDCFIEEFNTMPAVV